MSRDFLARSSSRSNAIRRRSTSALMDKEEADPKDVTPQTLQSQVENEESATKPADQTQKVQVQSKTTAGTTPSQPPKMKYDKSSGFVPFCVDNLEIKDYDDLKRAIQHHEEMAAMLSQYATNMGYMTVQKM